LSVRSVREVESAVVGLGRSWVPPELEAMVRARVRSAAPRRLRLRLSSLLSVGASGLLLLLLVVEVVGSSSVLGFMEGSLVENRSWMSVMEGADLTRVVGEEDDLEVWSGTERLSIVRRLIGPFWSGLIPNWLTGLKASTVNIPNVVTTLAIVTRVVIQYRPIIMNVLLQTVQLKFYDSVFYIFYKTSRSTTYLISPSVFIFPRLFSFVYQSPNHDGGERRRG